MLAFVEKGPAWRGGRGEGWGREGRPPGESDGPEGGKERCGSGEGSWGRGGALMETL